MSADEMDRASEAEQQQRDDSIAAVQRRVAEAKRPLSEADRTECLECGEEIDPARRAALPLVSRCIECAQAAELRMRRGEMR